MLARKYDNYAWEEQQQTEVSQPVRQKKINTDPYRRLRFRVMLVAAVILGTYLLTVFRSEAMVQYGSQLVGLRQQEARLIEKNNELKIEVEQLKGPERIIGLAEQRLGMSVARSNIYVKAAGQKNSGNTFTVAAK